jgi:hypothetical protein
MATPVTPVQGLSTFIVSGGNSVPAAGPNPNGGYITNPLLPADQGISAAESLLVDPVGNCGGASLPAAFGTVVAIQPGQTWDLIPGQTTPTYVNAQTSGHKFTVVVF